jgi:hypothetical protein
VADAAGAARFAWYGYSWLALAGLQLAIRTDRLTALAMGWPPLGGPYAEMLRVTIATHDLASTPIDYGQRWGGVHVSIAGPLVQRRAELETLGWQVQILNGLDHTQAMQAANVLPMLRLWLDAALAASAT